MVRWGMTLVVAAAAVAGCTPSYRVHVNTFLESDESVSPGASIRVAQDPNAANPILAGQIEAKLTQLLEGYGYRPIAASNAGDYLLTFQVGTLSDRTIDYVPTRRPFGGGLYGGYGGYGSRWRLGYSTYTPYYETVYVHWLRLRLLRRDGGTERGSRVVWIGEAQTGREDPELREAVNYLLVASMEHFPDDTRQWVSQAIRQDDPRILDIQSVGPETAAPHRAQQ